MSLDTLSCLVGLSDVNLRTELPPLKEIQVWSLMPWYGDIEREGEDTFSWWELTGHQETSPQKDDSNTPESYGTNKSDYEWKSNL